MPKGETLNSISIKSIESRVLVVSVMIHFSGLVGFDYFFDSFKRTTLPQETVKVVVVDREPPKPTPILTDPIKKTQPISKPKKRPKPKFSSSTPKTPTAEKPKPVLGLDPDSFSTRSDNPTAPSARVGNSLMTTEVGDPHVPIHRLTDEDLSSEASLIQSSIVKPEYTDEAIAAGLEGIFKVDLYCDALGQITQVELRRKIGYGMDERVLQSAKNAKFVPRKDKLGRPQASWTQIVFRLELP